MRTILAAAIVAAASPAYAVDLSLACDGRASVSGAETASAQTTDSNGYTSTSTVNVPTTYSAAERLRVEFKGDTGRILIPRMILPALRTGGMGDGWWELREVEIGESTISSRFVLNFLNKPKVKIDRTTGDIDISGMGIAFRGVCEKIDPTEKKF